MVVYKLFFVPEPTVMQGSGDRNEPFVMHFMNKYQQVRTFCLFRYHVSSFANRILNNYDSFFGDRVNTQTAGRNVGN